MALTIQYGRYIPLQQSIEKFLIALGTKVPFFIVSLALITASLLVILKGIMNSGFFCFAILLKTTFGLPQKTHVVDASVPFIMISPPHSLHE